MAKRDHDDSGKFAAKSDSDRAVRSIRATDETWAIFGDRADEHDMTRADYLEALLSGEIELENDDSDSNENELDFDLEEVTEILKECLTMTGKTVSRDMKKKIKEVLELMGEGPEND